MTHRAHALLLATLGLFLPACGNADATRADGGRGLADSSPPPTVDADASVIDSGPEPEATGYPATMGGTGMVPGGVGDDFERNGDSSFACYDGLDNDGDSVADCADDGCAPLHSCCVGDGDCCFTAPGPTPPTGLVFAGCGPTVADCFDAGAATSFGSPSPFLADDGFAPGGDGSFDSGIVFEQPLDLTSHRVVLAARFGAATDCGGGCLEGVGVSLTADTDLGDESHVRVLAGLLASGSRGDVALLLSDTVVTRWAHGGDEEVWSLIVRPTGEVSVLRNGVPAEGGAGVVPPIRGARVAVHGHSRNPTADPPPGTRLLSLDVSASLCDMPTGWGPRSDIILRASSAGEITPPVLDDVSLGYDGAGRATVALGDGEAIFLAKRPGVVTTELTLTDVLVNPALVGARPHDVNGVFDPELIWDGAGWVLLYGGEARGDVVDEVEAPGMRSIGRATAEMSASTFTADDDAVLDPSTYGVLGFDQPTVAVHSDGTWVMVVRTELPSGELELWAFLSNDQGQSFRRVDGVGLGAALRRGQGSPFDADEVAQPSLAIHGGAYRLYFAQRTGARWAIGLVVSDELIAWRHPTDGAPVLLGEGDSERVGVASPSVFVMGETVELYYLGLDGVGSAVRRTERVATSGGL